MCSCHSILECYNLFSGVKLGVRSFCFAIIAIHTRPEEIISDNAKTFKAAAVWINKLMRSEAPHGYLVERGIKQNFMLAKSPWLGGFCECMNRNLKAMTWQKLGKSYLFLNGFSRD